MSLSNFYEVKFTDEHANTYHSTEQYLQHQKALLFQDEVIAFRITSCETPLKSKSLSYQICKVDEDVWQQEAPRITKKGLIMQFRKNANCVDFLRNTGLRTLREASPSDKFWGTGVGLTDPIALNQGVWNGENKMGKLLEEVQNMLK